MRLSQLPRLVALAAVGALIAAPTVDAKPLTDDALIVPSESHLVAFSQDSERTLVELGFPSEWIRRITPAVDGSALVLDVDGYAAWVDLSVASPRPVFLPCSSLAQLSADGNRVACGSVRGKRAVVYTLRPNLDHDFFEIPAVGVRFSDEVGNGLVSTTGSTLVGVRASKPSGVVAPHAPSGSFLVAPDGTRAVGSYDEEDAPSILYSFRLDGKGARRRLLQPATAVAFSRDSEWVLAQHGDSACVVRAVGGEYKCWRGYTAIALSSHGRSTLLAKPSDTSPDALELFEAELNGPHSKKPRSTGRTVSGAAGYLPPRSKPGPQHD